MSTPTTPRDRVSDAVDDATFYDTFGAADITTCRALDDATFSAARDATYWATYDTTHATHDATRDATAIAVREGLG